MIDWTEERARDIAQQCDITLSDRHWEVIHTLRQLYVVHHRHPPTRIFMKALQPKSHAATMLELMQLFGERPMRMISQIAGLPPPPHCI